MRRDQPGATGCTYERPPVSLAAHVQVPRSCFAAAEYAAPTLQAARSGPTKLPFNRDAVLPRMRAFHWAKRGFERMYLNRYC